MQKIGISGGTFNPIHIGHLIIAEFFADEICLNKCFFVPAWLSPYKTKDETAQMIDPNHRAEMVKLAIEDNDRFDIDMFEIEKKAVSYTYNTILHFEEKYPDAEIYLLIGTDQAKDFHGWGNWEKILEKVQLCIAERPGYLSESEKEETERSLTIKNKKPLWLRSPLLEISSSNIRSRIKEGLTVKYLIHKKVEKYIIEHKLYI